ncbi:mannitol dehydrogenase family protein [Pararhizobium sp. IMCC21322]|uniref:mannitol dehydrogenase family protein n=1 Tax=Pararhizobium sp. IMCC21322 TaxID=3067903 RepID=UPI002741DB50|nr:mannitol dehydrogenase family protein [Pararhizobium sp. IMCC21322]
MNSTKLNETALQSLPDNVAVPNYDRSALKAGILHIGVGNFHRAHQAVYLHELFSLGEDHDWALVGAGIKPYDTAMRERLQQQDWLTTVVELDPDGFTAKVSGSMIDFVEVDPQAVIERLASPEIRIVSLTITEGGYFMDDRTGGFDHKHPDIVHDVKNPDAPETVFGVIIAAIQKRRADGVAPFTIMSCDNLPENGIITRQAVLGLAMDMSPDLEKWIEDNVSFPNSMVDCITPATSDRERAMVEERFGIVDAVPVACEPFRQWVMEDKFPGGRPALEKVGVEFVSEVAPYELMKLRILNGGHAAIAYPAALLGYHFVHEAMADPFVDGYLAKLETSEIIPTVPSVPGVDFQKYLKKVRERFSNAAVADTIPRLCLDGSNRQPKFIIPTIMDRLAGGDSIGGLALEVALWCRYCAGTDDAGNAIELFDEKAARLTEHALRAKDNPAAFLEMTDIFGQLGENAEFAEAFSAALTSVWSKGTKATLQAYLA